VSLRYFGALLLMAAANLGAIGILTRALNEDYTEVAVFWILGALIAIEARAVVGKPYKEGS